MFHFHASLFGHRRAATHEGGIRRAQVAAVFPASEASGLPAGWPADAWCHVTVMCRRCLSPFSKAPGTTRQKKNQGKRCPAFLAPFLLIACFGIYSCCCIFL
ncbi:hypothetical protein M440DRAFT_1251570 [Trichoderma longibrachiatum ATCC 18648]|uniref:Uncharacterized protein n=1 Tax=Trichoderma longibrachiatum ATCC 18648 TaxID=983965 RepID=A0A2T4C4B4_TRILO|nr:hypothetical protein M440DRAFT_1251570 [Trichoderma longibrachiatum ATCC 18648]